PRRARGRANILYRGSALRTPAGMARPRPARFLLSVKRVTPDDRLDPVWAGGNHVDRHAANRLQALQIGARRRRQLVVFAHAHGAVLPAREDFIDRLAERRVL